VPHRSLVALDILQVASSFSFCIRQLRPRDLKCAAELCNLTNQQNVDLDLAGHVPVKLDHPMSVPW
jgi:hypothetical protein